MPLNKSCSAEAFRENISTEIRAGKSASQAAAIARSTIEDACKREGKPVPSSIEKAKHEKPKSREYLEAALAAARKVLPGWQYAAIHRAAFPSSGGNAARNRRLSAAEKAFFEGTPIESMPIESLASLLVAVEEHHTMCTRKGWSTESTLGHIRRMVLELEKRDFSIEGPLADEARGGTKPTHLPEGTKIAKGFINGEPEGGMHAHGLDRRNGKTMRDGPHIHLFVLPGSGEVVITIEDGSHAHAITDGGNITKVDGDHSHMVELLSGDILETKLGGKHSHVLMVETSGFDGLHKHKLKLEDGTEVESLSPGEFVARFVDPKDIVAWPIESSRAIANALNEVRRLRDEADMHGLGADGDIGIAVTEIDIDIEITRALAEMAKGGDAPEIPSIRVEVDSVSEDGRSAMCGLVGLCDLSKVSIGDEITVEPGDIVEVSNAMEFAGFSENADPHTDVEAISIFKLEDAMWSKLNHVNFTKHDTAKIVFVSASPSPLEMARKEALVGADGEFFARRYLAPMGLTKADVATGFAIPVACDKPTKADIEMWRPRLTKALAAYPGATVVALGRVAKQALGKLAAFSMPHPAAVRRHGDRGELARKVKAICKSLDTGRSGMETLRSSTVDPSKGETGATLADSISELSKGQGLRVAVIKSVPEKRIIYGVVLDPYQVDLQGDWLPPAEIESTAHDFLAKSRVIGLQHEGVADANIVESWVELYPPEQRELALQNLPHKVFRRKFGSDIIHSGAWMAGVKLSVELWSKHESGDIGAFSIGGFSFSSQISIDAMPEVEFIDLEPSS